MFFIKTSTNVEVVFVCLNFTAGQFDVFDMQKTETLTGDEILI